MSRLDDILNDMGARLYCLGQDYQQGDGSPFKVDDEADKAKLLIKDLMLELIGSVEHLLSCPSTIDWRAQRGPYKDPIDCFEDRCTCGAAELRILRQEVEAL